MIRHQGLYICHRKLVFLFRMFNVVNTLTRSLAEFTPSLLNVTQCSEVISDYRWMLSGRHFFKRSFYLDKLTDLYFSTWWFRDVTESFRDSMENDNILWFCVIETLFIRNGIENVSKECALAHCGWYLGKFVLIGNNLWSLGDL